MHVSRLTLHDFRSYAALELALQPGVTALLGRNGQGKTNVVEAVDYLSRLTSHRVATDAPLVRHGASRAVVAAAVVREGRTAVIEVEINPGRSNRARVNRSPVPRARDVVGLVRTVLFSPEDLALVKGEPAERRRFLDELMVLRTPRLAGVRADYERVLRQRNALLRSMAESRARRRPDEHAETTLEVWDQQLVALGAEVTLARQQLVVGLEPLVGACYAEVAQGARSTEAAVRYLPSVGGDGEPVPDGSPDRLPEREEVAERFRRALQERRLEERRRGLSLVGPHRDDLALTIGDLPAKGYASHGESWSFALALRLASYDLLRSDGDDPILILDDVFAELDTGRRDRLAKIAGGAEQVLVTAAVAQDVPPALAGERVDLREVGA